MGARERRVLAARVRAMRIPASLIGHVEQERAELFNRLGLPVAIGYGLTEASTVATVNDLRPFRGDSVGRTVEGVELRIVGADATGVGEVQLSGPTLMLGYLDDEEQTRTYPSRDRVSIPFRHLSTGC